MPCPSPEPVRQDWRSDSIDSLVMHNLVELCCEEQLKTEWQDRSDRSEAGEGLHKLSNYEMKHDIGADNVPQKVPVVELDPDHIHSTQSDVRFHPGAAMDKKVKDEEPIYAFKHKGKIRAADGHHRAFWKRLTGQKVKAYLVDLDKE